MWGFTLGLQRIMILYLTIPIVVVHSGATTQESGNPLKWQLSLLYSLPDGKVPIVWYFIYEMKDRQPPQHCRGRFAMRH